MRLWVLEQLLIKPAIYKAQASITGEVLRFSTTLKLRYRKANDTEIETAEISMDYALFEMVSAMKEGYHSLWGPARFSTPYYQTRLSAEQSSQSLRAGSCLVRLGEHDYKVIFEQTDFGYEFKVVQA